MNGQLSLKSDSVFKVNLSQIDTANASVFQTLKNNENFISIFKHLDSIPFNYAFIEVEQYTYTFYNKSTYYESKEYYFNSRDSTPVLEYINSYQPDNIDSISYKRLIKELNQNNLVGTFHYSRFQKVIQSGCVHFSKQMIRKRTKEKLSSSYRIVFIINKKDETTEIFYNVPVKHPHFFLLVKNTSSGGF